VTCFCEWGGLIHSRVRHGKKKKKKKRAKTMGQANAKKFEDKFRKKSAKVLKGGNITNGRRFKNPSEKGGRRVPSSGWEKKGEVGKKEKMKVALVI